MINRYAIIIESSNVKGLRDLPGARTDAANWRSFLKSELGGAWRDEEICVLNKPERDKISASLYQYSGAYVFLAFSGHGFEQFSYVRGKYVTKVCLNDNEQAVDIDTISPKRLGTAIFDCCRGIDEESQNPVSVANESFFSNRSLPLTKQAGAEVIKRLKRRQSIRELFLKEIANNQQLTALRMYSCSRGEEAEDFEGVANAGGYYTTFLLRAAKEWEKRLNTFCCGVYSTKQAHDFACAIMARIHPQQHPEYTPGWQSYPFAIGGCI